MNFVLVAICLFLGFLFIPGGFIHCATWAGLKSTRCIRFSSVWGSKVLAAYQTTDFIGTETADHPPSPSIFDIIPGVEDEVDVESELMSVEEWDGCSQTLIEDHCPVTRSRDLKLRNEEDITSSAELQDIIETTSDTSTDNSEPVLIQEWREAQRTRRKRRWQRYTQEKTNDFPRFKRLILKINKLKVKMEYSSMN